jgi:hypothetical protein
MEDQQNEIDKQFGRVAAPVAAPCPALPCPGGRVEDPPRRVSIEDLAPRVKELKAITDEFERAVRKEIERHIIILQDIVFRFERAITDPIEAGIYRLEQLIADFDLDVLNAVRFGVMELLAWMERNGIETGSPEELRDVRITHPGVIEIELTGDCKGKIHINTCPPKEADVPLDPEDPRFVGFRGGIGPADADKVPPGDPMWGKFSKEELERIIAMGRAGLGPAWFLGMPNVPQIPDIDIKNILPGFEWVASLLALLKQGLEGLGQFIKIYIPPLNLKEQAEEANRELGG